MHPHRCAPGVTVCTHITDAGKRLPLLLGYCLVGEMVSLGIEGSFLISCSQILLPRGNFCLMPVLCFSEARGHRLWVEWRQDLLRRPTLPKVDGSTTLCSLCSPVDVVKSRASLGSPHAPPPPRTLPSAVMKLLYP